MAFSFSFSAQASLTDGTLESRIETMLDYADTMEKGSASKVSTYLIAVETLADNNIQDPELIKRVTLELDKVKETYSPKDRKLFDKSLKKIYENL